MNAGVHYYLVTKYTVTIRYAKQQKTANNGGFYTILMIFSCYSKISVEKQQCHQRCDGMVVFQILDAIMAT